MARSPSTPLLFVLLLFSVSSFGCELNNGVISDGRDCSSFGFGYAISNRDCKCFNRTGDELKAAGAKSAGKVVEDYGNGRVVSDSDVGKDALDPSQTLFFRKYFELIPAWNTKGIKGISRKCRLQSDLYLQDLKNMKLWALKMYDSTAKIPPSIFGGNINQYGGFDQCLDINNSFEKESNKNISINGKYCLVNFQIKIVNKLSNKMKYLYDLSHSHQAFKSELVDPGHRVPRFSSISWGTCIPDGCSAYDVQIMMQNILNEYVDPNLFNVTVMVDPHLCQQKPEVVFSNGFLIVSALFLLIFGIVLFATICDSTNMPLKNEIVMSFSLKRTINSLFSLKRADDDIKAVHGIRCINAILLIISHKSMSVFFNPYINRTAMAEHLSRPFGVVARSASLYTDPFLMFSGLLTYNSIMNRIERNKNVSILDEYIGRLFRLIPTLGALILFCTWILPELGSGPQWPLVVDHHAHMCKKYWWRNFLFIHNYFGFENMCLTHTHHIGIDTQLFIIGVPIIVWMGMNKKFEDKAMKILIGLAIISTITKFYISYSMNLANYVYFGVSIQELFRTANHMYILPAYRFPIYLMGIILAKTLRQAPDMKLSPKNLTTGWIVATALFCIAFFGQSKMGSIGYKYDSFHNALFAAFNPIAWCCSFAWIIYTSHHGYNSFLGNIFSSRIFIIWTRASYAVYLTQFPIFFFNIGTTRGSIHYKYMQTFWNEPEYIYIAIFSIILTVVFDLPFQKIKKSLLESRRLVSSDNKEKKTT